jgi:(p)ppGpp synthase/HD superfamily hydrolase
MNQTTGIILIAIEGAGLLITVGFGIAAYKAYRKGKKRAEQKMQEAQEFVDEIKTKANHVMSEFEIFAQRLRGLVG